MAVFNTNKKHISPGVIQGQSDNDVVTDNTSSSTLDSSSQLLNVDFPSIQIGDDNDYDKSSKTNRDGRSRRDKQGKSRFSRLSFSPSHIWSSLSPMRGGKTGDKEAANQSEDDVNTKASSDTGGLQSDIKSATRSRRTTDASASILGISRSFAGFLTTASVYAGFEDLQEAQQEENEIIDSEAADYGGTKQSKNTIYSKSTASKSKLELSITIHKPLLSKEKARMFAEMLRQRFKIPDDCEFVSDYNCWLMGDVLLQGHLFITTQFLFFSAYLPKRQPEKIIQQGTLSVKSAILHRRWIILKEGTLSVFSHSNDLYFPDMVLDLKAALRAEIYHKSKKSGTGKEKTSESAPVWFKVLTPKKAYWFQADSMSSARSWVSAIKKQIFQSRNKGDQAIVKIPLRSILDFELTTVLGETKNLRIKVIENADSYAIDDYFLLLFSDGAKVAGDIRNVVDRAGVKLTDGRNEEECAQFVKRKAELMKEINEGIETSNCMIRDPESIQKETKKIKDESQPESVEVQSSDSATSSTFQRVSKAAVSGISTITRNLSYKQQQIVHVGSEFVGDPFYIFDKTTREKKQSGFLKAFSLHDQELRAIYHGYCLRGLPVYGKVFISTDYLCFQSSLPGSGTLMILPLTVLENASKEKGFRFGYCGLVVVIKGHEELFFEFSTEKARDDCECQLLRQKDRMRNNDKRRHRSYKGSHASASTASHSNSPESSESAPTLTSARIKLVESKLNDEIGADVPILIEDNPLQRTVLKPLKHYRFTLLTIGSRGDVQPYIALGKALKKEGHSVRIVTHGEFEPWIKSHGLEFAPIAGDPSELMSLMVSHPTISYSFVREAKSKFSSWINELLDTSWKACQGTDVLIESPSSFSGIHIAEALGIAYFRAFTMPWSRTRAYPNAFMVPDQKLGGSYNYMTHVVFENGYWRGVSTQVNKWRENTLHIPRTTLAALKQNSVPFLYNMSPVVFPPSVDFPEWVKVTGYWFLNEGHDDYKPPEKLKSFIKDARRNHKKLVYIGFGSIVVEDPHKISSVITQAVLRAGVWCVLNKGWSERGKSKGNSQCTDSSKNPRDTSRRMDEFPPEILSIGSIPHDWLFPRIDAAVHHGGSGTTGASLKFGLPTVIKPFFGDQKFYANRVEDLGCGIALKELTVSSLASALKEITTNNRLMQKAEAIGSMICKENGVQNAIAAIYSEMKYAKNLSLQKRRVSVADDDKVECKLDEVTSEDGESWLLV